MTQKTYLNNTYQFTHTAKIIEIREIPERGQAMILDQTIFYPQGGGQPADTGIIKNESGTFEVTDTRLDTDGTIFHFGNFTNGKFDPNQEVQLEINQERRILNAKLHSAGHLLDVAIEQLGYDHLTPQKGFHFPDGPYVEYDGVVDAEKYPETSTSIQEKLNQLQTQKIPVIKEELSNEEAAQKGIWTPPGKSARIVKFQGTDGCGCGGTHVENNQEIGQITIKKIKSKKGKTKISYTINLNLEDV